MGTSNGLEGFSNWTKGVTMDSKLTITKSEIFFTLTHLGGRVKSWIETAANGMTNEFVELSEGDAGVEIKLKKLSQGKAWDHGQKQKQKQKQKGMTRIEFLAYVVIAVIATVSAGLILEWAIRREAKKSLIKLQDFELRPSCTTDTDCWEKFKF